MLDTSCKAQKTKSFKTQFIPAMGELCRIPNSPSKNTKPLNNMQLTSENLHAAASAGSGFNYDQLDILGVVCPPRRGWLQKLIGTHISDEDYAKVLSLKSAKQKKSKSAKNEPGAFAGYQLPPREEKPRESPAGGVCVAMQVPLACVETVQSLIRLHDALAVNRR